MKPKTRLNRLTVEVLKNGTVNIKKSRKLVAFIAPEIFTEGWAKSGPMAAYQPKRFDGLIPLANGGQVGLKTTVKASKEGLRFRFALTPIATARAIHVRVVINLPYHDWRECSYRLGGLLGSVPTKKPKNNRLAEDQGGSLTLGPSWAHRGLVLGLDAPGLYTVLQDNRQWTPYLHAFVNRHEHAETAWKWMKGKTKAYEFTLRFNG